MAIEEVGVADLGFVGLGSMGLPMARRLAERGHDVRGHDVDPAARERARGHGLVVVESLGDLAGAGLVVTMLPDGAAVRGVADTLAPRLSRGGVVVDTSSSDPASTLATAEALGGAGVWMIDAPVSGNPDAALRGELTLMVGGDEPTVSRALPMLHALGHPRRIGRLGAGHALKSLNNLLASINLAGAAEVMLLGRRYGLEPATMLEVLNMSTGRNDATASKVGQFVLSRSFDSGFRLSLMRKDIGIAIGLARSVGIEAPLGDVCLQMWEDALNDLGADADNVEIVRWMEQRRDVVLETVVTGKLDGG